LGHPGAASLDQAFVLACLLMGLALLAFLLIEWPVADRHERRRPKVGAVGFGLVHDA
jgi:thiamine transport system permease protein